MEIKTRMLGDELFESVGESGNPVTIDARSPGERQGQSPPEILLSAVAACSTVDVISILKKRRKTIQKLDVVTNGTRAETQPRYFTAVHCEFIITSPDVEHEEAMKAAALSIEKYCTVAASLKAPVTFSVKILRP